ncbi:hypothetical protein [Filifactor alocis]|uniref:hypothetical protein n=1 Tax=Filifactor alocis TaxID=143361 RepID=UPI003F9F2311
MNFEDKIKRDIQTAEFAENNGRIIRTVNVLRGKWIRLSSVRDVLDDINLADLEQSLIYLERSEYIAVRDIETKIPVEVEQADYSGCEVSLTKKGIDVALYFIKDAAVKV